MFRFVRLDDYGLPSLRIGFLRSKVLVRSCLHHHSRYPKIFAEQRSNHPQQFHFCKSLRVLIERRRVWAFQEAALAPSNTCFVGQSRIALLDIVRAAQWIFFHGMTYSHNLLISNLGLWCAGELHNLIDEDLGFSPTHEYLYLTRLINTSTLLLASEPRDHLYGLVGLWSKKNPS